MADTEPAATRAGDAHPEDAPRPPGAPRWVKASALVALVVVLLLVAVMLLSGGEHGPGRHSDSGGPSGQLGGHAPPDGGH